MSDKELDVSSEDYVIVVPDEKEGNGSNCSLQKESRPNIFFPRKILESLFPVGKTAAVSQLSGGTCTARDICSRSTMTTNAISQCCGKNVQSHDIKDEEESNEPGVQCSPKLDLQVRDNGAVFCDSVIMQKIKAASRENSREDYIVIIDAARAAANSHNIESPRNSISFTCDKGSLSYHHIPPQATYKSLLAAREERSFKSSAAVTDCTTSEISSAYPQQSLDSSRSSHTLYTCSAGECLNAVKSNSPLKTNGEASTFRTCDADCCDSVERDHPVHNDNNVRTNRVSDFASDSSSDSADSISQTECKESEINVPLDATSDRKHDSSLDLKENSSHATVATSCLTKAVNQLSNRCKCLPSAEDESKDLQSFRTPSMAKKCQTMPSSKSRHESDPGCKPIYLKKKASDMARALSEPTKNDLVTSDLLVQIIDEWSSKSEPPSLHLQPGTQLSERSTFVLPPSEQTIRDCIEEKCVEFVNYTNWNVLLPHLAAKKLLDRDLSEILMSNSSTTRDKGLKFYLSALPSKGSTAYTRFYDCILQEDEHSGHRTLLELMNTFNND